MTATSSALPLPGFVGERLDAAARSFLHQHGQVDFAAPAGEPALADPDSVSWRIFANPVALFIGGVAAVIMELAEPRVRAGVWDHSSFRTDPVTRLQRTGMAAMITVYGARSQAVRMITGVVRRHDRVRGVAATGEAYGANDVELLDWVQATATYGFAHAWDRYVQPLSADELDRVYVEALPAAALYGAHGAPRSGAQMQALTLAMTPRLEASPVIFEFLDIMARAPIFPAPLRPLQRMLISAAVDLVPPDLRRRLDLEGRGLKPWQRPLVRAAARAAGRVHLDAHPAAQASRRLGLPADHLWRD